MASSTVTIALLVFLIVVESTRVNGFHRWDDDSFRREILDLHDDCSGERCASLFPIKRNEELEEIVDKAIPISRALASYRGMGRSWEVSCPCETQYDITDLGLDNYPRYLATARCVIKGGSKKYNPCRLLHYKIHVLRPRDASSEYDGSVEQQQYVEEIMLPESLRVKWQMKPMKIAVACVANDGKKN